MKYTLLALGLILGACAISAMDGEPEPNFMPSLEPLNRSSQLEVGSQDNEGEQKGLDNYEGRDVEEYWRSEEFRRPRTTQIGIAGEGNKEDLENSPSDAESRDTSDTEDPEPEQNKKSSWKSRLSLQRIRRRNNNRPDNHGRVLTLNTDDMHREGWRNSPYRPLINSQELEPKQNKKSSWKSRLSSQRIRRRNNNRPDNHGRVLTLDANDMNRENPDDSLEAKAETRMEKAKRYATWTLRNSFGAGASTAIGYGAQVGIARALPKLLATKYGAKLAGKYTSPAAVALAAVASAVVSSKLTKHLCGNTQLARAYLTRNQTGTGAVISNGELINNATVHSYLNYCYRLPTSAHGLANALTWAGAAAATQPGMTRNVLAGAAALSALNNLSAGSVLHHAYTTLMNCKPMSWF